jgi:ABC-type branched-subunit amino acid transport system permease subunit
VLLAVAAGFLTAAVIGLLLQVIVFRRMQGQDLRQTLVTIGLSIMLADVLLWIFGGEIYTFEPPKWIYGSTVLPIVAKFPTYRIAVFVMALAIGLGLWWFLARTRVGMMIRAGVDDRGMLAASGVNVQLVFAVTFAIGAGLAGFAGVVGGSALSISPGEDTRYLLASLVVVIVGGMGSIGGAAIGALLIGAAEQFGTRLCADLFGRLHLRDHGAGARLPTARNHGEGCYERLSLLFRTAREPAGAPGRRSLSFAGPNESNQSKGPEHRFDRLTCPEPTNSVSSSQALAGRGGDASANFGAAN